MRVEVRDCLGDPIEQNEGLARVEPRQHTVSGRDAAAAVAAEVEQLLRVSEMERGSGRVAIQLTGK